MFPSFLSSAHQHISTSARQQCSFTTSRNSEDSSPQIVCIPRQRFRYLGKVASHVERGSNASIAVETLFCSNLATCRALMCFHTIPYPYHTHTSGIPYIPYTYLVYRTHSFFTFYFPLLRAQTGVGQKDKKKRVHDICCAAVLFFTRSPACLLAQCSVLGNL